MPPTAFSCSDSLPRSNLVQVFCIVKIVTSPSISKSIISVLCGIKLLVHLLRVCRRRANPQTTQPTRRSRLKSGQLGLPSAHSRSNLELTYEGHAGSHGQVGELRAAVSARLHYREVPLPPLAPFPAAVQAPQRNTSRPSKRAKAPAPHATCLATA